MKAGPRGTRKKLVAGKGAQDASFPVVAIGASAGGLEAVTQLLQNLPNYTGMAFVFVQHLSPDHKSFLASLLSKTTAMKVQEVKNKMFLEPNNLYVTPPDKEMIVLDGHIKLRPRAKGHIANLPIDAFFCSLAKTYGESAIGIILSGSASDGTQGLSAIKDAGGLTFAQDDSAKFGSMPKSAIASGAVDFILSPKKIARELTRLSKYDFRKRGAARAADENEIDNDDASLKVILQLLLKETGVDFGQYKMTTVKRRILRRLLMCKIKTLKEYVSLMKKKGDEINILHQDLLINVTSFFRDAPAHRYLKATLFPRLLKNKTSGETLRIWIPACSTGEEAYSIAMTLLEIQTNKTGRAPIQIFATDLSAKAIAKARIGEYSKQQLESVSPKRLQRFYTRSGNNYRISKLVRDLCVFAPHNILLDPPFSHVDFISCCNLLIYLDAPAQKKVISTFYYGLVPEGYLMLGKSEAIGSSGQLFTQISRKFKIYSRNKTSSRRSLPDLAHLFPRSPGETEVPVRSPRNPTPIDDFGASIDAILLSRYVPACVVINHAMEILLFRGRTDYYLRHLPGKANLNILKMVSHNIAFELRHAISKTIKTKLVFRKTGIEMKDAASVRTIGIEVAPVTISWDEPLLLILFTESDAAEFSLENEKTGKNSAGTIHGRIIKKLRKELSSAHADMHSFAQEQEAFNEELQNANEEIVSSNEELQSVNEELETSKEEMESTNEELITTNQELQTRNDLLHESYEYSEAIITTMHEPMIILDKDLRVKSANRSFYNAFRVTEHQTELTLLYDLGNKQWNIPRLRELLEEILTKNTNFEDFEVTHTFPGIGERIMLLNASRIIQQTHGEQLILLAFNDITDRSQLQLREKAELKENIRESLSHSQDLEVAVDERTKELEYANAKLEEKNTELEAFAYVSSHDLQEPLRKIQTFSARILDTENQNLSERGKDYFNRMQRAAARMQKLIEDLLSFSHLNVAERTFEITDLNKIVEEAKIELKETIEEKQAVIHTVDLGDVNLIPFQFRQLMLNLLTNALKFSKPGHPPHVIIKSSVISGNKLGNKDLLPDVKYCHITFSDNGIGFDPQYKDRIFQVFQRLHGKDEYAGTGIGLAIVKKVVENHSGFITVNSNLNEGATFDIYLPVI